MRREQEEEGSGRKNRERRRKEGERMQTGGPEVNVHTKNVL